MLELLRKRASVLVDGQPVTLSDNNLVEQHLQDCDILCIEDMANEVRSAYFHEYSSSHFIPLLD